MKKLLAKLSLFLLPGFLFGQTSDNSVIFRINGIYVDEIFDGGDEGTGSTAELAFIVGESDGLLQTVGLEIGYITSDLEDSGTLEGFGFVEVEVDANLIPIFANFAVQGEFTDANFIWEAGIGIGGIIVDIDVSVLGVGSESDDDFVLAGQIFSSVGYKFSDSASLSAGIRYMLSDDADYLGVEIDDTLNSVAFDVGLNLAF